MASIRILIEEDEYRVTLGAKIRDLLEGAGFPNVEIDDVDSYVEISKDPELVKHRLDAMAEAHRRDEVKLVIETRIAKG